MILSWMGLCWKFSFVVLWWVSSFFWFIPLLVMSIVCLWWCLRHFIMAWFHGLQRCICCINYCIFMYIFVGSVVDKWWWLINVFENKSWVIMVVNKLVESLAVRYVYTFVIRSTTWWILLCKYILPCFWVLALFGWCVFWGYTQSSTWTKKSRFSLLCT